MKGLIISRVHNSHNWQWGSSVTSKQATVEGKGLQSVTLHLEDILGLVHWVKYCCQSETTGVSESMLLIAMEFSDWTIIRPLSGGLQKSNMAT